MKAFTLSLLVVIASLSTATAQRNTLLVYGTIDAESHRRTDGSQSSLFNFSPGVGYQWNSNWTGGVNLQIGNTKVNGSKASLFSAGPFIRYTYPLSDIFVVYGQFNANVLTGKEANSLSYTGFSGTLFPAIGVNLRKGFALNFTFGGLSFVSSKTKGQTSRADDFTLGFGSGAGLAISKNFGLKR